MLGGFFSGSNFYPFIRPHNSACARPTSQQKIVFTVEESLSLTAYPVLFLSLYPSPDSLLYSTPPFYWLLPCFPLLSWEHLICLSTNSNPSVTPPYFFSFFSCPPALLFSPSLSSRHVCIHEEPTPAPAFSGPRLAQTPLQKPVGQAEGWRVISGNGKWFTQKHQQVCRCCKYEFVARGHADRTELWPPEIQNILGTCAPHLYFSNHVVDIWPLHPLHFM